MTIQLLCIVGPTASGKSSRAVEEALARSGEIISVDSRQVYRGLDIGTEKIPPGERKNIPHHLIDIREPDESYSAGDFVANAARLIGEISARGKLPILVGGTHFYFDALTKGLPTNTAPNYQLRKELERLSTIRLFERIREQDPRRANELDPHNRRRLIRALEIIDSLGSVPPRSKEVRPPYQVGRSDLFTIEWIVIDPPREKLRKRIDTRLKSALARGLVDETRRMRDALAKRLGGYGPADRRLNELGLEYKLVGEFLRGERLETSLSPALSAKLWQYARRQKAWLRNLGHGVS